MCTLRCARTATLLLCALIWSACGADRRSEVPHRLVPLALSEGLVIGSADGSEPYTFTRISDITVDPSGRIYVLDQIDARILVFDHSGRFVRTVGRRGEGPGEFVQPTGMGWVGDTLWVSDQRLARIALFDTAGSAIGTRSVYELTGNQQPIGLVHLAADRSLIVRPLIVLEAVAEGLNAVPLLRVPPGGTTATAETLAVLDVAHTALIVGNRLPRQPPSIQTTQPLRKGTRIGFARDGSLVVMVDESDREPGGGQAEIRAIAPGAGVVFHVKFPSTGARVTRELSDSLITHWSDALVRRGWFDAREARSHVRGRLEIPSYQPSFDEVVVARDGTTWLRRFELPTPPERQYLVLDTGGTVVADVVVPDGSRLFEVSHDAAYGVRTDTLGVQYVVRYSVHRGGRGIR
jgi:hypothetical protein